MFKKNLALNLFLTDDKEKTDFYHLFDTETAALLQVSPT
jgi:hypothetical protein